MKGLEQGVNEARETQEGCRRRAKGMRKISLSAEEEALVV